jgi:peptide/nickel transport system substrate-binding protein
LNTYNYFYCANMPVAPGKFRAFRDALGTALNRRRANQVAFGNNSEEQYYATNLASNHPYFPGEDNLEPFTEKPEGDKEAARQKLSEAGWGWDDNGRLHYPPDADLTPHWPKGKTPAAGGFPCVEATEDGTAYNPDWRNA